MKGLVFAIEEMAVHDGPGLRTTVFLKGCPLRCQWCHNPEGWEPRPQRVRNPNGCTGCGACTEKCPQKKVPNEFNLGMDNRRAIYIPFAQAANGGTRTRSPAACWPPSRSFATAASQYPAANR